MAAQSIEVLIPESDIRSRIAAMGSTLHAAYTHRPLTVVSVLTGGMFFTADLLRRLDRIPIQLETVTARSYRNGTAPGPLQMSLDAMDAAQVRGRDVLIVDDILDSGVTLTQLVTHLRHFEPASLRSAVLLRKIGRQRDDCPIVPDDIGFDIPNKFVVGYGMDYNGLYRNLPFIGVLDPGNAAQAESPTQARRS